MDTDLKVDLERKTLNYILNNTIILKNDVYPKMIQRSNAKLNLHQNEINNDNDLLFINNIHIIGHSHNNIEYYYYLKENHIYKFRYNKKNNKITYICKK